MRYPALVRADSRSRAFTIFELLSSAVIFAIILIVVFGLVQQAANAWQSTSSKIAAFQDARAAFDTISEKLSQATLNTYYDYVDASGNSRISALAAGNGASFNPANYSRYSDLHFVSGKSLLPSQVTHSIFFQTPAGYTRSDTFRRMDTLLNACGFYVQFGIDTGRPTFLSNLTDPPRERYRYRLFEFLQPAEELSTYTSGSGISWFTGVATHPDSRAQLAENIIALILLPRTAAEDQTAAIADQFEYDSRDKSKPGSFNQLPPLIEVLMVAVDESAATRLENGSVPPLPEVSDRFRQVSELDADLKALESDLTRDHINFRTFRTAVPMRGSKWSSQ